jgi:hypothetical protein
MTACAGTAFLAIRHADRTYCLIFHFTLRVTDFVQDAILTYPIIAVVVAAVADVCCGRRHT